MPGTTPIYGLPYQTGQDQPDGAQGLQDLAEAVEGEFERLDTGIAVHIRTTAGNASFTKPSNPPARYHIVQLWGAGGAGGGCIGANPGTSEGGGGGGGAYTQKVYLDSELDASEGYTVGAGGTGVSGAAGNNGGSSTFKGLTAGGGGGGQVMTSATTTQAALRGAGGTASGGDLNCAGDDGGIGRTISGTALFTNYGGGSPGGGGITHQTDFVASAGTSGKSCGGGGSGAFASTADQAGGAGAAGKILIYSIY
jgi:hypothetical protein